MILEPFTHTITVFQQLKKGGYHCAFTQHGFLRRINRKNKKEKKKLHPGGFGGIQDTR